MPTKSAVFRIRIPAFDISFQFDQLLSNTFFLRYLTTFILKIKKYIHIYLILLYISYICYIVHIYGIEGIECLVYRRR